MRFNCAIPGMLDQVNKILSGEVTLNKFTSPRVRVEIDFYAEPLLLRYLLFVIIDVISSENGMIISTIIFFAVHLTFFGQKLLNWI